MRAQLVLPVIAVACFNPSLRGDLPCSDGWCPPPQTCGMDLVCHSDTTVDAGGSNGSGTCTPGFAAGEVIQLPGTPESLAAVDLRGTGLVDLLVGETGVSSAISLSLFHGLGGGNFDTPMTFPVGTQPVAIATGTFDNDADPDVAVIDQGTNQLFTLKGNAGTLEPPVMQGAGAGPRGLASGTFITGQQDLAIANSNGVTVMTEYGGSGWMPELLVAAPVAAVAIADVDTDGNADIVAVEAGSAGVLDTWPGSGNGSFGSAMQSSGFVGATSLALADIDGDGKLDAIVAEGSAVSIVSNAGNGTFSGKVAISTSTPAAEIAVFDFNGRPTIAAVTTELLLLVPGMTQSYAAGMSPVALAVADFNQDGHDDIAVADEGGPMGGEVRIFLYQCVP